MAFAEFNSRVIYVLLQSDWFVQNLELEPLNPGRSAQTNLSFPLPANFRTRMYILGQIRLARESRVRACLCVRPLLWACVRVFSRSVSLCTYVFFHESVIVCVFSCVCLCVCFLA